MKVSKSTVLLAYRHLYQHLLRAVQYSKPARYEARDRLRAAFRNSNRREFDATKIQRTLEFLDGAAKCRGLEHHIVKNLMFVGWTRGPRGDLVPSYLMTKRKQDLAFREKGFTAFDETIRKLNESMGLCIK